MTFWQTTRFSVKYTRKKYKRVRTINLIKIIQVKAIISIVTHTLLQKVLINNNMIKFVRENMKP